MAKISVPKINEGLKKAMEASGVKLKKNLTPEIVERDIIKYLDENNVLHLATISRNNKPRATPIEYKNNGMTIYLFSEGGVKISNIKHNPSISLSIASPYNRQKDYFGSKGVQVWGKAYVYTKKDNPEKYKESLEAMKIKETSLPDDYSFKVIIIEPDKVKYMAARNGYWGVTWEK